jgi:hypothetical protein
MGFLNHYVDDWQYPLSNGRVTIDVDGTLLDALKRVGEDMFYDYNDMRKHVSTVIKSQSHVYNDVAYQDMHIKYEWGACLTAHIHPSEIIVAGYKTIYNERNTFLYNLKDPSQITWMDGCITTSSLLELHENAFSLVQHINQLNEEHEEAEEAFERRSYTGHQVIEMMESKRIYVAYRWNEPNIRLNYAYQDEFKKRVVMPSWTWNARKHIDSMTSSERTNHIEAELNQSDWVIGRYECI